MTDVMITRDGLARLREELERLTVDGRREIAERIAHAAASAANPIENADYLVARDDRALLEQRIAVLEDRLRSARIVEPDVGNGRVDVGERGRRGRMANGVTGRWPRATRPATLGVTNEGGDVKKSIVCGVDGSADSDAALAVAARLADRLDARLVLANVVEYVHPPYATTGAIGTGAAARAPLGDVLGDQVGAREQLLEEIAERANVQTAERRVVAGFAAERLADLADEENAELIVVGSRGRGAFKAAFLGSVSTSLIGVARCPVLVVPPGAREP